MARVKKSLHRYDYRTKEGKAFKALLILTSARDQMRAAFKQLECSLDLVKKLLESKKRG